MMSNPIIEKLRQAVGNDKISTEDALLQERRHDYSFISQLDDLQGRGAPVAACVAMPANTADVVKIVNTCRENNTTIIPFGLGSGVVAGVIAHPDAVMLDMSSMKRIRKIDTHNLLATFEAGVRGSDAEAALVKQGLMLGHYPQSIDVSSVGGWVATRACGQFSSAYGSIEDVVMALEVVLPNGEILETRQTPRASAGPDLKEIFLGSEGTLGIVTAVTFSVRWQPEKREYTAFYAPNMNKGFELQRNIMQHGWEPPVMRQYDHTEVKRLFPDQYRGEDSLLIMVHEGPAGRVAAEIKECLEIAGDLGCDPAPTAVVEKWFVDRNHVSSFDEFLTQGVVVDTIEIAAVWDKIGGIYKSALSSLNEVENMVNASAHSSHCYRSGLNLYFTFAVIPADSEKMSDVYHECWRRVLEATHAGGGGIAHHHGIGRIRRDWMPAEVGDAGMTVLRALKKTLDPEGIMNPGVLLK
ncbi:MAG: FAD-binding oxidoreductase [Deltaproteobacteria bacterium]|nr:FAD-binding oxidoreductase [Deltaproteobacteria bacterium]MBT6501470.1 FAD-binding oxidoreductase [Deltaproteobacteria bacterium]MBT7716461.1 FAD-binding oxidoreductase [Deltaproteobacteria bacterium]